MKSKTFKNFAITSLGVIAAVGFASAQSAEGQNGSRPVGQKMNEMNKQFREEVSSVKAEYRDKAVAMYASGTRPNASTTPFKNLHKEMKEEIKGMREDFKDDKKDLRASNTMMRAEKMDPKRMDDLALVLGMSTSTLKSKMASGTTVATLIAQSGKSSTTVGAALRDLEVARLKADLTAKVAAGKMTQAQADKIISAATSTPGNRGDVMEKVRDVRMENRATSTKPLGGQNFLNKIRGWFGN